MIKCKVSQDKCRDCVKGECPQRYEFISKAEREEIIKSAIRHFGETHQEDKAIEEMSELTKALLKMRAADDSQGYQNVLDCVEDVLEEMIDVQIMLDQLKHIYGWDMVTEQKKLIKLKGLIEDGEGS